MPPVVPSHKLIFINQFFWPDNAPTAVLLDQTVRHAADQGHQVTVVCGDQGYVKGTSADAPAVRICRVPSLPFSRHPISRMLSWGSFLVLSACRLLFLGRNDIIVTMTTPPGLSIAAALLKRFLGARLWIWEMDVYPDVVVATGGLSPESLVTRILQWIFTWSRRRADGIIVLGQCMKDRLRASGVPAERIHIAENWSSGHAADGFETPKTPPLRILYSGNLGMAHEVETIQNILQTLASEPDIRFVFAGGGAARPGLEQHCRAANIPNVTFQSYGDSQTFAANLHSSHVGLVTLRNGCEGTVVPSKIYSLLSIGCPILFIGPKTATPALLIGEYQCGWHFEPGRAGEVSAFLKRLSTDPSQIAGAGQNARKAFEKHYNQASGTARLLQTLLNAPC